MGTERARAAREREIFYLQRAYLPPLVEDHTKGEDRKKSACTCGRPSEPRTRIEDAPTLSGSVLEDAGDRLILEIYWQVRADTPVKGLYSAQIHLRHHTLPIHNI